MMRLLLVLPGKGVFCGIKQTPGYQGFFTSKATRRTETMAVSNGRGMPSPLASAFRTSRPPLPRLRWGTGMLADKPRPLAMRELPSPVRLANWNSDGRVFAVIADMVWGYPPCPTDSHSCPHPGDRTRHSAPRYGPQAPDENPRCAAFPGQLGIVGRSGRSL